MTAQPVTLTTCEEEPIHIPGSIQPHGALLALDGHHLVLAISENFHARVGLEIAPGQPLPSEFAAALEELLSQRNDSGPWSHAVEAHIGERLFDVIGHAYQDVFYLEFEPREAESAALTTFALNALRIIGQVQHRHDIQSLLEGIAGELRRMTGYDRVMAYRFHPDLSGEVVAEARRDDLESYLGQRYPASDIPAQARRLYIENRIRLIADVDYHPARLLPAINPHNGQPFDLSFSALRSVSPIHCEYLHNMGVRASMSISIVVGDRLWGLFSCHHMTPKTVPFPVRLAFQVLSQVCSVMVERLEASQQAEALRRAAELQAELSGRVRDFDDPLAALMQGSHDVSQLLPCHAAAVMVGGRILCVGEKIDALVEEVVNRFSDDESRDLFHHEQWQHAQPGAAHARYCGVLAIRFHRQMPGWVLWFRLEEVQTITWGGKPEKILKVGPSGARLTPRGSFEAWEEVVRGRSSPWSTTELDIASKLRAELVDIGHNRSGEVDRMRQRLIAILGHDLRNPLQSISMAAAMLSPDSTRNSELRKHITSSSGRMERMIAQILEMSRLQSGGTIAVQRAPADLSALVSEVIDEVAMAYPGLNIEKALETQLQAPLDSDRFAQVLANLLSNARHHGRAGRPIRVELKRVGEQVRFSVYNEADPLSAESLANLFTPFKRLSGENARNKGGLGIGLYISRAIAEAHDGNIEVEQQDGVIGVHVSIPA